MSKDYETMDTYLLLAELDDLVQFACMHDSMDLIQYLSWTHDSGFNHLISVLKERCDFSFE